MPAARFHPAVQAWFDRTFPSATEPQRRAWPAIAAGRHTLIAAPTGSGKTLAAFLAAIDALLREGLDRGLPDETRVVYVSPLKALSNDIERNLQAPLAGIREELRRLKLPDVDIRVQVRTGDTSQSDRAAMRKLPPHILVTTPESLYLLLTSESGRAMLATARTVIVDEIHAVAGTKRGAHLALSLERLEALAPGAKSGETLPLPLWQDAPDETRPAAASEAAAGAPRASTAPDEGIPAGAAPTRPAGAVERSESRPGDAPAAPAARRRLTRIGLSATQKPIEEIARFLLGAPEHGAPECVIIDTGHVRARDLALELPGSPLSAVMANEVWEQLYDRLAQLIEAHRTTLVFVNTRRLAERVTRHLSERLGKEHVTSHHGSLAKEIRFDAEQRLKNGELRALVATASLELGIDIGDVDLVCQLGSPRSIAAFLQRVGRSGHSVTGTPKGRLFPLTRDELIECTALLHAVEHGELDRLRIPAKPLDVLAQQIVAEVGAQDWAEDALYAQFRRAWPYRDLTRAEFTAVVRMLADGFATRRGRRAAYLHRDAVNGRLRARKGARLTALTCGGAIPDNADYRVVLEPTGTHVGTLNEDFAVESMAGDIFQLGNASYRILKIEPGIVRAEDAKGAPPTIPFWIGEAPSRTDELSAAVSRLRAGVDQRLGDHITAESLAAARAWLAREYRASASAAEQIADYLGAAKGVLHAVPTQERIVFERFFDETGGMQLVIHAPFGNRLNRAWGLALRKRFCRKFNFELQAAATEDAIVLSLGETHSFALDEVARYLHSESVRDVLVQALLDSPLFTTRWRWNASTALAVRRFRGGRKNPAPLQRMDAEDLVAVVFPDQIACAENLAGEREIPDHPLVAQTIDDCLHEAMDIDGLVRLLRALEAGRVQVIARDLPHPSPLAQEILNARPYAFLDDAPLEERRTQAVMSRRWLDPLAAGELGRLDPDAIARVRAEAWPEVSEPDELHDALMLLGFLEQPEGERAGWTAHLEALIAARRATRVRRGPATWWVAAEQLPLWRALHPDAQATPVIEPPAEYARAWDADAALIELARGRLQGLGPVSNRALARSLGVDTSCIDCALAALEGEGFAMRGQFTADPRAPSPTLAGEPEENAPDAEWDASVADASDPHPCSRAEAGISRGAETLASPANSADPIRSPAEVRVDGHEAFGASANASDHPPPEEGQRAEARGAPTPVTEWCERRLLARIHRYTVERLRAEIEPVTAADFMRFLFDWHGLTAEPRPEGPQALGAVIEQLEGYEAAASAWESDILPARTDGYDPDWLDSLCRSGRVLWARLTPPKTNGARERSAGPVRNTPIALLTRRNLKHWQTLAQAGASGEVRLSTRAQAVADYLAAHGASFFEELTSGTRLLKTEVEEALRELVALGLIQADGYSGLRALLLPADRRRAASRRRRGVLAGIEDAGRWSLLQRAPAIEAISKADARRAERRAAPTEETVESIARTLLRRYGVVFRRLLAREPDWLPSWLELLRVYRRLEARGEIRGGRFVAGVSGEQYALAEAVPMLRALRRKTPDERWVSISAADPLNLVGIVTPGARVPGLAGNRVLYRAGVPVAVQIGDKTEFLLDVPATEAWGARNALIRGAPPASAAAH